MYSYVWLKTKHFSTLVFYKNFLNFRKGHKEITEAILKLNIPELGDHFIYIDKVCHLEKAL